METYNNLKNKILDINQDLRQIIRKAGSIDGLSHHPLEAWKATTGRIHRQLVEEMIRVAVVGSIKSGKSTLVNALFEGDYLKRGAGVVTSIVTKVRPGKSLKAELEFKTWDDINADMNQALILFSATDSDDDRESFDINREKDRDQLQQDLSSLNTEQLISDGARDPNSLLLTEYLRGYDQVESLVSFEPRTHILEQGEFHRQKDFVGDESLAVYLKDVLLTLIAPEGFGENLEIADCQGSDSPNPLHLVMIQDYLIQAHLIIYVLSSRTGLRQADIKFLTIIKKMGLLKNIFFVLNCDFSEHEDLQGLMGLINRVRNELGMILPNPEVFTFSALYNLFRCLHGKDGALLRKDLLRLEQWREERDMAAFSDQETDRFVKAVVRKISSDRFHLLLQTNLERISTMASSMGDWVQINHHLLSKDADEVQEAFAEMEKRREASDQVTAVIKDTLDGSTRKLKRDLGDDVERFFDLEYGDTVQGIIQFVDAYGISVKDYEEDLQTSGFLSTLYRIFQALREATNRYMAESINPKLVDFVRLEEERIKSASDQVSGPYSLMIQDAVDQYQRTVEKLGIKMQQRPFKPVKSPDVGMVKSDARLNIPPLVTTMRYSARIKTEAILRLGIYNTFRAVRKLLKKRTGGELESALRSLDDSVRRIKEQLRESITHHLVDYKGNLKYQYLFKLVDAVSSSLYEALVDRMRAFTGSLSDMSGLIKNQRATREQMIEEFVSLKKSLSGVIDKVREVEEQLESESVSQHSAS
ncbi:MAG: dynamin family protein [Desulfobacterales bacterium]|nr:MAG: dynamin family protein [Desulfobacterales bacterium]